MGLSIHLSRCLQCWWPYDHFLLHGTYSSHIDCTCPLGQTHVFSLLASSNSDLKLSLGQFAAECVCHSSQLEKGGLPTLDRGELLSPVKESSILGLCSWVRQKWSGRLIDGLEQHRQWCGCWSGLLSWRESQKAKLSIYRSIYVPTLTYGHELWLVAGRIRLQRQVAKMSFLCRVAGLSFRDRMRSSNTQ